MAKRAGWVLSRPAARLAFFLLATSGVVRGAPPLVDSFAAAPATVPPGGSTTLTLQAHDPDCAAPPCTAGCGAYIRADLTLWSATGGTLSGISNGSSASPYTATASWQAPLVEGSYTVTVTISDSGTFLCGNRQTVATPLTIIVSSAPPPVIDSFQVTPSLVPAGGIALLTAAAHDPLGRALTYAFSAPAGVIQQADPTTPQAQWTAPSVGGPVAITCTVTPASGPPATSQVTAQVAIGAFLGWLPAGGDFASKVAPLPDGGMAVIDSLAGAVQVRDVSGSAGWRATGLAEPVAAAAIGSELFVLERSARTIAVLDAGGRRVRTLPLPVAAPTDLAAGPSPGEISVTDAASARVWVLSSATGAALRSIGDGVLGFPSALSSWGGRLAVADTASRSIVLFDGSGTVLGTLSADLLFVRPQGVVWDGANDQLVTADTFTGELTVQAGDGTVKGQMGGYVTGDQQLVNPTGVTLVAGDVLAVPVASTGRVALYRLHSAFPLPSAVVSSVAAVCEGTPGVLASVPDAGAGATYAWSISNGTITAGDGTRSVTFTAGSAGSTDLAAVVSRPGGSANGARRIAVGAYPAAPVATSSSPLCEGGTLQLGASWVPGASFAWSGPNGFTSSLQNPAIENAGATAGGTYSVVLSVNGCAAPAASTVVSVLPSLPAPAISAPGSVPALLPGSTAGTTATPGSSYTWSITNGRITAGQGTSQITFTAGGAGPVELRLVETSGSGCTSPEALASITALSSPEADVVLSAAVDALAPAVGQAVTLTVVATNNGPQSATGLKVTDLLPAGLTFVSAAPTQGSYDAPTGAWDVGTLPAGSSASLPIVATVSAAGAILDEAVKTALNERERDPSNDSASVGLNAAALADVQLHARADDTVPGVGGNVGLTVTMRNAGPSDATNVVVANALPAGLTFSSAAATWGSYDPATGLWTVGDVVSGGSAELRIVATVAQAGTIVDVSSKMQAEADPQATNDSASVTLNAVAEADVAVSVSVSPEPAIAGSSISWTLVVVNLGPASASNVTLVDTLPSGLASVSASPSQGACGGGATLTCGLGTLPPGASASVTVAATRTAGGTLSNSAQVSADQPDPYLANNTTSAATTPVELTRFEAD